MGPPKFSLHAIVVHLPIGAWTGALIFDLLTRFHLGGNTLVRLSFLCVAAGIAGALVAVPTGLLDWSGVKKGKPAWKLGLYHMATNLVVTVVFALNLAVRWSHWQDAEMVSLAGLALSLAGTALLFVGAYLGGLMLYDHGVSVARSSKHKWREVAERAGSNVPQKKEG